MRKVVTGIVIGAVLAFSGQAMADSISKIGKKVDAEYSVVVDGKTLDVKAFGVEGVSTTPNRALGNAIGYDVSFKDDTVYFTKKEVIGMSEPAITPVEEPAKHYFTIETITVAIKELEGDIWATSASIESYQERGLTNSVEVAREALIEQQAELIRLKAIKAELEAQQ